MPCQNCKAEVEPKRGRETRGLDGEARSQEFGLSPISGATGERIRNGILVPFEDAKTAPTPIYKNTSKFEMIVTFCIKCITSVAAGTGPEVCVSVTVEGGKDISKKSLIDHCSGVADSVVQKIEAKVISAVAAPSGR